MNKISICIPAHDLDARWPFIQRTIKNLAGDERVQEFVVVCDAPTDPQYHRLGLNLTEAVQHPAAVVLARNATKLFVLHNKWRSVRLAQAPWVCLLDSDNVIDRSYLDAWERCPVRHDHVYLPEFARPEFDYRRFAYLDIRRETVHQYMDRKLFDCLLNTCNFVVHRDTFLLAMGPESQYNPLTADSMWINYRLLLAGCRLVVCPGMQYDHAVHEGSTWRLHHAGAGDEEAARIGKLLRELR